MKIYFWLEIPIFTPQCVTASYIDILIMLYWFLMSDTVKYFLEVPVTFNGWLIGIGS
ncbi:hypothetical protein NIES39_A06390 [Arthrospira platensis NIES-39]|nr:hypothetical protein NIES39_A06390 [Arthrospira platensis NIES-39]